MIRLKITKAVGGFALLAGLLGFFAVGLEPESSKPWKGTQMKLIDVAKQERFTPAGHHDYSAQQVIGEKVQANNVSVLRAVMGEKGLGETHVHQDQEQIFYVLQGELSVSDGQQTFSVPAGHAIFIPPGTPHEAQNSVSDETVYLVITAPPLQQDSHGQPKTVEYRQVSTLHQTGRFSHYARTTGRTTLYVSGQVALDEEGNLVGAGDFETQVRQVYGNLQRVLDDAGATWADVAMTHIYIVGFTPERYARLRAIRAEFIGDIVPVATVLGVEALAVPGFEVEVELIVVLD